MWRRVSSIISNTCTSTRRDPGWPKFHHLEDLAARKGEPPVQSAIVNNLERPDPAEMMNLNFKVTAEFKQFRMYAAHHLSLVQVLYQAFRSAPCPTDMMLPGTTDLGCEGNTHVPRGSWYIRKKTRKSEFRKARKHVWTKPTKQKARLRERTKSG